MSVILPKELVTEIQPGLYLGGFADLLKPTVLLPHVISMNHIPHISLHPDVRVHVHHPINDEPYVPDGIDDLARYGFALWHRGPLLVHCTFGFNRSGMVVARILMEDGLSADSAIVLIREKRPGALSNQSFVNWLRDQQGWA